MRSYEQLPEEGEYALRPHVYPDYIKFSLLFVVICLLLSLYYGKEYISATKDFHKAEKMLENGDIDGAKDHYKAALHLAPASDDIRIGLAIACFSNKDSIDDEEGINYIYDISLTHREYQKVVAVLPAKYQKYLSHRGSNDN